MDQLDFSEFIVEDRSKEILKKKLEELSNLRINQRYEVQFQELETELSIGKQIALITKNIRLEPLNAKTGSSDEKSPDYSTIIDGREYLMEVTTFRVEVVEKTKKLANELLKGLEKALMKRDIRVNVDLNLPLGISIGNPRRFFETEFGKEDGFRHMQNMPRGSISKNFPEGKLVLNWTQIPTISSYKEMSNFPNVKVFAIGSKENIKFAYARSLENYYLYLDTNGQNIIEKRLLKSLKSTLRNKKRQFTDRSKPSLVIIDIGVKKLEHKWVLDTIENNLFKDSDFKWLSGVGVSNANLSGKIYSILFVFNPSAYIKPLELLHNIKKNGVIVKQ